MDCPDAFAHGHERMTRETLRMPYFIEIAGKDVRFPEACTVCCGPGPFIAMERSNAAKAEKKWFFMRVA